VEFEAVRGMEGIKKATVTIGDKDLRVAVVATPKNARLVLEEIKANPDAYHYVEFMACPGGCIGGGGQPIPSTKRIIKQRTEGLYAIDNQKQMRLAHKNPLVLEFLAWCKEHGREHELLHTQYSKKKRGE
jgi:NADP-reducing hydrogenase subunit HndD